MSTPPHTFEPTQPLAEAFATYASAALEDAGAIQQQEVRRAFYSGAFAWNAMLQGIVDLPEDLQARLMNAMDTELQVFRATLGSTLEGKV